MSISFKGIVFWVWFCLMLQMLISILRTIHENPLHITAALIANLLVLQGAFLWFNGMMKGEEAEWARRECGSKKEERDRDVLGKA
jgi:hypothetical protein